MGEWGGEPVWVGIFSLSLSNQVLNSSKSAALFLSGMMPRDFKMRNGLAEHTVIGRRSRCLEIMLY